MGWKHVVTVLTLLLLAASPSAFTWGPWEFEDTQQPVEQQTQGGETQPDRSLWVINNTGCAWDADDSRSAGDTDGTIAPGSTAVGTKCLVADWDAHAFYVNINSRSPDLVVEMRFGPQGFVVRAPARASGNRYVYEACVWGPSYDRSSPDLQPTPNSGYGGVGVMTVITVSVHNPSTRTVRDTHGLMRMRFSPDAACGFGWFPFTNRTGTYPGPIFYWGTG